MRPGPDPADPGAAWLTGQLLGGRYRVEEAIGHGGMSTVYRARDERLQRPVALKVIREPVGSEYSSEHLRERFRREAANAARIPPHPNVVQVYDYGTDPELELDYLVMELLQGQDLKAALREREFSAAHADQVLLEAARGLAAGHQAGLVHRDVKPSNLFLVGADRLEAVRVLDFGIAKAFETDEDEDLTLAGGLPHTPAYTSPEQHDPTVRITPASDVYQWGLVAYELLAGVRPYDAGGRARIARGEPVPLPVIGHWDQVTPTLRTVVERALEPDPRARFPDGAALAEALARSATGETVEQTVLAPRTHREEPDATVLQPQPQDAPPADDPAPTTATGPAGWTRLQRLSEHPGVRIGTSALLIGILLAALLWPGSPAPELPLDRRSTAELEAEFAPLYQEAAARLAGDGAEPDTAAALAQVRAVIQDVNESWERGEMARHLAHYADVVEVDEAERSREELRARREAERARYDEVEITAEPRQVELTAADQARALVRRTWRYEGEAARREGEVDQEYELELRDGRWQIVAEREVQPEDTG